MSARLPALAAALSLAACSYNLDVLTNRRDASADRARTDVTGVDAPGPDVPPVDRPAADAGVDAPDDDGPARPSMTGACTTTLFDTLTASEGGVTTVSGTTVMGAANALVPPCRSTIMANSTRAYRYTVRAGPRLVATTNTGLCGAHDTVLAAYFSCDHSPMAVACNDDDMQNLCVGCADAGAAAGCDDVHSTLELTNLVPGDVLYFVVNSYRGATETAPDTRGAFRLSIAENGLAPAPAPAPAPTGGSIQGTDRCACPPATPAPMTGDVEFPTATDIDQLAMASNRAVFGNHPVPFQRLTGASAHFTLSRFAIRTDGPCAVMGGAKAALDLVVGNRIVASGALGISVGGAGAVTIPFTSFAPYMLGATTGIPFQFQLRNVTPADTNCITLDIDPAARNVVTLSGS